MPAHATGSGNEPFLPIALASLAGPFSWVLHFAVLYLLEGFLCAQRSPPRGLVTAGIVGATAVLGGCCLALVLRGRAWLRHAGANRTAMLEFLFHVCTLLSALSLLAILWAGSAVLFLSACYAAH
jgi:hypothetical protein